MVGIEATGSGVLPRPPKAALPVSAMRNSPKTKEARVLGVLGQLGWPEKMEDGAGNPMVVAELG